MDYTAVAESSYAAKYYLEGMTAYNFRATPFVAFNRKDDSQAEFIAQAFGLKGATKEGKFTQCD